VTLSLRDERSVGAEAELVLDEDLVSPRDLQRELWKPDQLGETLLRALRTLCDETDTVAEFRATLAMEHNVDALDGAYASAAAGAMSSNLQAGRLLEFSRQLGGTISADLRSSLEDVRRGPVQVLAASEVDATVALEMTSEWWQTAKSTQRVRFLRHLQQLTPGVDVQIIGSKLVQRRLLSSHADELPASVSERAQSRLFGTSPSPLTRTEEVRDQALALLDELGDGHVDWPRLATLLEPAAERRSYDDLEADVRLDMLREAVRQFVSRCRDRGLVESMSINGEPYVRLTRVGLAALAEHPDVDVGEARAGSSLPACGWSTDVSTHGADPQDCGGGSPGVSNPPNSCDSTVLSHTCGNRPGDRPDDEAATAAAGGSEDPSREVVEAKFLSLDEHHAAAAAAPASGFALSSRPLDDRPDVRAGSWSFDEDRNEVVVRGQASSVMALTMTRLCAALLSDKAMHQVLKPSNLDGGPAETALRGLAVSNDHVLRHGACLGWLRRQDANGDDYHQRLEQARRDLLASAGDLDVRDLDEDHAGVVLSKAHGLFGTVCRIYDLLGIDVVVDLEIPNYVAGDEDGRADLARCLGKATACASRYGVYSANRVLWEPRGEKREETLGTPSVDVDDPVGTVNPSWVLSGPKTDLLQEDVSKIDWTLHLQEDGKHFAEFLLRMDVVDGDRREALAEAASRLMSFGDLEETRAAVSLLAAFTSNTLDASRALWMLSGDEDEPRELDFVDVRSALAMFGDRYDPTRLLEDVGGRTVSKVAAALLDAEQPLSKAELATAADVSKQSISDNSEYFDQLEAAGLLDVSRGGPGKPSEWRIHLPFRVERHDSTCPTPGVSAGKYGFDRIDNASGAVFEVLTALADELGHDLPMDFGGPLVLEAVSGLVSDREVDPLLEEYPAYRPLAELVVHLEGFADPPELTLSTSESIELGADPSPASVQTSLDATTAAAD